MFVSGAVLAKVFSVIASFAYNQLPHKCLAYITALRLKGKTHTKFAYANVCADRQTAEPCCDKNICLLNW